MQNVVELMPDDFVAERFQPVFERVWKGEAGQPFDAAYFFPQWRMLMDMKVARTWAADDSAVLGALFVKDVFSGILRIGVQFWFCLPEARHSGIAGAIFRAFEDVAYKSGAWDIHAGAHQKMNPSRREYGYTTHGFVKSETMFIKELWPAY